ncbi:MAG: hypothetical protein JST47_15415 [Bacteroidetes bacterium]|nr:hypothetical protein [Bacteroidota bacterium]
MKRIIMLALLMFTAVGFTMAQRRPHRARHKVKVHHKIHHHHVHHHRPRHK